MGRISPNPVIIDLTLWFLCICKVYLSLLQSWYSVWQRVEWNLIRIRWICWSFPPLITLPECSVYIPLLFLIHGRHSAGLMWISSLIALLNKAWKIFSRFSLWTRKQSHLSTLICSVTSAANYFSSNNNTRNNSLTLAINSTPLSNY